MIEINIRFKSTICLFLFLFTISLSANREIIKFKNISSEKGLSQLTIECMLKDKKGFIWFGTQDGLNRYDGYKCKVYKNDPSKPNSISDNYILSMVMDNSGAIWIATENGLNKLILEKERFLKYFYQKGSQNCLSNNHVKEVYIAPSHPGILWVGTESGLDRLNIKTDEFTHYQNGPENTNHLTNNTVKVIYEAPSLPGVLWIGTDKGMNSFDFKKNIFKHFTHDPISSNSICNNDIRVIYEAASLPGRLWIGTKDGLDRYDMEKNIFTHFKKNSEVLNSINYNDIRCIFESRSRPGTLWIGTFGGGLNKMDMNKNSFTQYLHETTDPFSIADNYLNCIFEDETRILWFGTQTNGFIQYQQSAKKFTHFQHIPNNTNSLNNKDVRIIEGSSLDPSIIWIGTYEGLDRIDEKTGTFTHFSHDNNNTKTLSSKKIRSILEDNKHRLWVGTYDGGLNLLNSKTGDFTHYLNDPQNPFSLSNNYVRTIYQDKQDILWIGTVGGGLNRFDEKNERFFRYTHNPENPNSISSDRIFNIIMDKNNILWIGTSNGLNKYNKESESFLVFSHDPNNLNSLGNNMVMCVFEDRSGQLWVGTWGAGINRFDPDTGIFIRYTEKDGLANNVVYGILEDDSGNLWCSTNFGLSRFNPENKTFKNYDKTDGLQDNEFNTGAYFQGKNGKMYFGGVNGLTSFYPQQIFSNSYIPPIVITGFQIFNQEVPIINKEDKNSILNKSIIYTDSITLSYLDDVISFEYSGLSHIAPERNTYAYMMEGLEKEWNYVKERRFATYAKIPPGNYTFKVKGANNDGIWNETGKSIKITILPPFWKTLWFYSICFLVIIFLILSFYKFRLGQLKNRKRELEKIITHRTEQLKNANIELEKLSLVASETDNAVIIMDNKGNIEWVNEGFTRIYDETLEQLINEHGKNIFEISTNPQIQKLFNDCIIKKKTITYESMDVTKTGKNIWAQTTLTPILDGNGNVKKVIAIDSDISKLKLSEKIAEEAREIAEKANQSKSQFLARMSHEIRTPMNGVIGFTDIILETDLNEEQMDYARTIKKSGEALITLLNDILDFSKIEAGELSFDMSEFDPEVTVFDVCDLIIPRIGNKDIDILCRIGDNVPAFVKSDPGRFRQVLVNLMGNASKFTNEGEIELSLLVAEEKDDKIKLHVKIRDTGIGILQEKVKTIFKAFHQADGSTTHEYGGTGLGLAICKQIAGLMGGDIWVESKENIGSTFHFTCWMKKSKKETTHETFINCLEGKKVLIVDDNRNNLEILSHILSSSKMTVKAIIEPENVIKEINKSFKKNELFDIAIIDIKMPGISGFELAEKIRNLSSPLADIPLLAFSSSTRTPSAKYKDSGFSGFLPKPIQRKKILKIVEQLLIKDSGMDKSKKNKEIITQYTIADQSKHSIEILLAEDNPINQKLAGFLLKQAGYKLTIVNNGKEVVDTFCKNSKKYNLILMDIHMPEMDGKEATRIIRKKGFTEIPIIAMTADAMKGDKGKCLQAGMNDYISKPIKREVVFMAIKKWCIKSNQ